MKAEAEFNYIVQICTDYVATLPESSKQAVTIVLNDVLPKIKRGLGGAPEPVQTAEDH